MNTQNAHNIQANNSERGAALITVLLMSTLMLATGGALVLVTSLSNRTAIDATAEMQAYYSAEAGVHDTLNVLRGNMNPQPGMPANSRVSFRSAVTPSASNRPGDGSSTARLSGWLSYNYPAAGGERVAMTANYSPLNGLAYSVEVTDPDNTPVATGEPSRVRVRVRGFGPKGAEKRLEVIVKRTNFDYAAPAMLMMRGADDCSPVNFTAGDSNAKDYSGHDNAPTGVVLPTFGATCDGDRTIEVNADTKDTVVDPKAATITISDLPEYLQTAEKARFFLDDPLDGQKASAISQNRYFTSYDGSPTGFTFVDGNCSLDGGSGLLIVTGRLTLNGNPNFDGLILVMGEGYVERNGAGNGEYYGAMAVARFNRNGGPFLAPTFLTDGSGTGSMQYDSAAIRRALNTSGPRVLGIHEQ